MIEILPPQPGWKEAHLEAYLQTDGRDGHYLDMSGVGGKGPTPTLILKTMGRKSGKPILAPLIYGRFGNGYAIVASKGGAQKHPAWFLNLEASEKVTLQVAADCFEATWRRLEGEERQRVWDTMVAIYPPYTDYAAATDRHIPLVMLEPHRTLDSL